MTQGLHNPRQHIARRYSTKYNIVRESWGAAFAKMAATGDDAALALDTLESNFDKEEWTW